MEIKTKNIVDQSFSEYRKRDFKQDNGVKIIPYTHDDLSFHMYMYVMATRDSIQPSGIDSNHSVLFQSRRAVFEGIFIFEAIIQYFNHACYILNMTMLEAREISITRDFCHTGMIYFEVSLCSNQVRFQQDCFFFRRGWQCLKVPECSKRDTLLPGDIESQKFCFGS